jgi:hypothetical protein
VQTLTWRVDELADRQGWTASRLAEAAGLDEKRARRPAVVSRAYLDTNFLYGHLRAGRGTGADTLDEWRTRAISEFTPNGGDRVAGLRRIGPDASG